MALIKKRGLKKDKKSGRWLGEPRLDKHGRPRWYAQVYVGRHPVTRSPQFLSKTFLRKKEAEQWARKQEGMKDKNIRPATSRQSLAEYLERWLAVYAGQVRSSTSYNISKTLGKWVLNPRNGVPPIGGKQLRKLTYGDFEKLYQCMAEHDKAPRAIEYLAGILRRALREAVKKGDLPRNPAEFATVPRANRKAEIKGSDDGAESDGEVVRAMTKDQADRFLAAAAEDRLCALWHVLLMGGLRPGEAFALRWADDVDFKKGKEGEVHVRATLTRLGVDRKRYPGGWKLTKPKTPRGCRTVTLPEITMQELRRWKAQQAWEKRTFQGEYQYHGFVFTTQVGKPLSPSSVRRGLFRRVMQRARLGEHGPQPAKPKTGVTARRPFTPAFRLYDLRHTHATLGLDDGVDLLDMSRRLGHASITITADIYSHRMPQRAEGVADHYERMFRTA